VNINQVMSVASDSLITWAEEVSTRAPCLTGLNVEREERSIQRPANDDASNIRTPGGRSSLMKPTIDLPCSSLQARLGRRCRESGVINKFTIRLNYIWTLQRTGLSTACSFGNR